LKRQLALLLVGLGLVVGARAYVELRIAPGLRPRTASSGPSLSRLSRADREKLKTLQTRFMGERDQYLKMKSAGAPAREVQAQYQKVLKAIDAVEAIGGTEAIRTLPRSKYAPRPKSGDPSSGASTGGSAQ
jgi:hypothetical protein